MYLSSRIRSSAPEILVAFLIFSLSTGVVGGVLLYVDSIGPDVLAEMSEEVVVDMQVYFYSPFYEQNVSTVEAYRNIILNQDYIMGAESISFIEINDPDASQSEYTKSAILGIEESFENSFPKAIEMSEGNTPLNETSCYVLESKLVNDGLAIGDNYTVSVPSDGGTLEKTFVIAGTFESNVFLRRLSYDSPRFSYLHVIILRSTLLNEFSSLGHSDQDNIVDRIWVRIDSGELLIEDPSSILTLLRATEKQIEQRTLPDASVVEFALVSIFYEYSTWTTSMRIISLAFSIPSIIMAVMLIQYNSSLESEQQRRSVGALKTRGASGIQATRWIMSVSLFTGLVGSIGAIITGLASALIAGGVRELMVFDISRIRSFVIVLRPQSIIILFLFSFVAGLLVTIPAAIRAFLMSPTDAHSIVGREDNTQEKKMGNPVYQAAIVGISGLLLIPLVGSLGSFADLSSGSALIGITFIIALATFIVGLTFLLARPSADLKAGVLMRIKRHSLIVGCRLLGRNVVTFTRTEITAVVFISLVFTAGVFSAIAATSGSEHMKSLFMFEVGADVVIDVQPGLSNVTLDMIDDIMSVEGVSQASGLMATFARVTYLMDWEGHLTPFNRSLVILGVQPSEFAEAAFLRPDFAYYGDPRAAISLLGQSEENAITNFKPIVEYDTDWIGNSYPILSDYVGVELIGPSGKHTLNCTIVDVLASTPGTVAQGIYWGTSFRGTTYLPGIDYEDQFVMLDIRTLQKYLNVSYVNRFYIDLVPDANYTRVMQQLGNIAPFSFADVSSPFTQIDAILNSRAGESIYGAYTLNILFSVLYLTAGITLVVTMKVRTLRKHFSLLRALGSQPGHILQAMLADSVIGVILGAFVGGIVGSVLSFIVTQMPLTYLGLSTEVSWGRLPLVMSVPLVLIAGILTLAFLFSTAATYFVVRKGLRANIAEDIQHSE